MDRDPGTVSGEYLRVLSFRDCTLNSKHRGLKKNKHETTLISCGKDHKRKIKVLSPPPFSTGASCFHFILGPTNSAPAQSPINLALIQGFDKCTLLAES